VKPLSPATLVFIWWCSYYFHSFTLFRS